MIIALHNGEISLCTTGGNTGDTEPLRFTTTFIAN